MRHSISNYIVTSIFIGIIALCSILFWTKETVKTSTLENRTLTQRPDATADSVISGSYSKRFETYFNDQFPARETFVELNGEINKYLLHQNVVRGVYVDKDGYLISPVPDANDAKAKGIAQRINTLANQAEKLNAKTYFALVPNKSTVMENKFPDYYPSFGLKDTDLLLKYAAPNTNSINPIDVINKHKNEDKMYSYTDHHWKAKAAFYAYQSIIERISKDIPSVGQPFELNDFKWEEKGKPFYGSDARTTTKTYAKYADTITVATPKFKEKPLNVCYDGKCNQGLYSEDWLYYNELYTNRYIAYMGGDHAEATIYNPNKVADKNLLIIKDSYANAEIQFFARHFKETRVLDLRKYNEMSVKDYIKKNHIDVVLIIDNVNSLIGTPSLTNYEHPGMG